MIYCVRAVICGILGVRLLMGCILVVRDVMGCILRIRAVLDGILVSGQQWIEYLVIGWCELHT